jgi:hypothetical protein
MLVSARIYANDLNFTISLDMNLLLDIVRGNSYTAKNIPHDDSPKLPKKNQSKEK